MHALRILFGSLALAAAPLLAVPAILAAPAGQEPAQEQAAPADPRAGGRAQFTSRGGAQPQGLNREQMWWAPTAEDWAKPVLIRFQRTWEDAVAVAQETGRPILICVNMDGEIASEHYAGVRYRQPHIAELYEPYVAVIASVYRHSPRDHDEEGRRVLCPRFGSVTCGEHIAIEPLLYERFFDGVRVAPRHILVEPDGTQVFDVFYAWDTDTVFDAIESGVAGREFPDLANLRGDRSIVERVASRDRADREAVEQAFLEGDADLRRALLEAAAAADGKEPTELLRLALFGLDPDLAAFARDLLARTESSSAVELIAQALSQPLPPEEREALVAALERHGEDSARARSLAAVQRGLEAGGAVDMERWNRALSTGEGRIVVRRRVEVEYRISRDVDRAYASPDDPGAQLELMESLTELALDPDTSARSRALLLADVLAAADRVEAARVEGQELDLGPGAWRLDAALALALAHGGNHAEAERRAALAVSALPPDAEGRLSGHVLMLFAEARARDIAAALAARREWSREWVGDVHAAYSVLARHPLGTARHVADHVDFLNRMGVFGPARRALDEGLERFPDAWLLHERLRWRILARQGDRALEPAYEALLEQNPNWPHLSWYAGYASLLAAEYRRREGEAQAAGEAYARSIAHFEREIALHPEGRANADHYVALALAGQARLAMERDDLPAALELLLASFERHPFAAASQDGLNLTPMDTARNLRPLLASLEDPEPARRLGVGIARLAEIDPELLQLPDYERGGPPPPTPPPPRGERRPQRR